MLFEEAGKGNLITLIFKKVLDDLRYKVSFSLFLLLLSKWPERPTIVHGPSHLLYPCLLGCPLVQAGSGSSAGQM